MSSLLYVQSLYQTSNNTSPLLLEHVGHLPRSPPCCPQNETSIEVSMSDMSGMTEMTAATQYCNQDGKEDFGDFVHNEDEGMDLEELAEPWDKYDRNKNPRCLRSHPSRRPDQ